MLAKRWTTSHTPRTVSTEQQDYTYEALSHNEIRLLILPSIYREDALLHVQLAHEPLALAQVNGYTALSYTWGELPASVRLYIDQGWIKIRPNLHRILLECCALGIRRIWVGFRVRSAS